MQPTIAARAIVCTFHVTPSDLPLRNTRIPSAALGIAISNPRIRVAMPVKIAATNASTIFITRYAA